MRPPAMRPPRALILTALASLAVGVLALLPGRSGTALSQTAGPPPPQGGTSGPPAPVVALISPAAGGAVTAPAARLTVDIPPGTMNQPIVLAVAPLVAEGANQGGVAALQALAAQNVPPPPPTGNTPAQVAEVFEIEATFQSGAPLGNLPAPVTISIDIKPEVLARAGGNMANLVLQFFDEQARQWVRVPTVAVGQTLRAQVNHFSVWAVTVQPPQTVVDAAPAPGETGAVPKPAATGTGLTSLGTDHTRVVLLAGTAGALLLVTAAGAFVRRRRRA